MPGLFFFVGAVGNKREVQSDGGASGSCRDRLERPIGAGQWRRRVVGSEARGDFRASPRRGTGEMRSREEWERVVGGVWAGGERGVL